MDHWGGVAYGNLLQCVGDALGDQIRVGSLAADNQPQCDHTCWIVTTHDHLDGGRDFKGAGHAHEVNLCVRRKFGELLMSIFNQRISEFCVILRSHNGDRGFVVSATWLWWQDLGHAGG